jgi:hypothetical protein
LVKTVEHIHESRKGRLPAGQAGILDLFSEVADHLKRVKNYKVWQVATILKYLLLQNLRDRN